MNTLDPKNAAIARKSVDTACRKVTVTLHLRDADPITCEGLEFHSIAGEAMVVHRTPWSPKSWQVTEPVTGHLVTNGHKTRSAAMIAAQQKVNKRPGCLAEAVRLHRLHCDSKANAA